MGTEEDKIDEEKARIKIEETEEEEAMAKVGEETDAECVESEVRQETDEEAAAGRLDILPNYVKYEAVLL